jgi:hypothetical protein
VSLSLNTVFISGVSEHCVLIELLVNLTISPRFKGDGSLFEFMDVIAIEMKDKKRNVVKRASFELFFSPVKFANDEPMYLCKQNKLRYRRFA